jgi:hypothetical protein
MTFPRLSSAGWTMRGDELLRSWSSGAAKNALLEFVESACRVGTSYVPGRRADCDRTPDNDRALWCGKPQYVQAGCLFRRWRRMTGLDPAKATRQPYKARVEHDRLGSPSCSAISRTWSRR